MVGHRIGHTDFPLLGGDIDVDLAIVGGGVSAALLGETARRSRSSKPARRPRRHGLHTAKVTAPAEGDIYSQLRKLNSALAPRHFTPIRPTRTTGVRMLPQRYELLPPE